MVFEGDIRKLDKNPMKIETPFGLPVASGCSHALNDVEELNDEIERLSAQLASARKALEVAPQHVGWMKQFILGMDESNWRDMQIRAVRQLDHLSADLSLSDEKGE